MHMEYPKDKFQTATAFLRIGGVLDIYGLFINPDPYKPICMLSAK